MFALNWLISALSFAVFNVIEEGSNRNADDPEQQALLEKASRADTAALGEIYDQYAEKIYAYIYHRVGQAELAEDLTGQVFMRMLEAIRSGQAWRTSFSGWLYRIAHNLVIDTIGGEAALLLSISTKWRRSARLRVNHRNRSRPAWIGRTCGPH